MQSKKWVILTSAAVLAISIAGCGSSAASETTITETIDTMATASGTSETEVVTESEEQTRAEKLLSDGEGGNGRAYTDLGRMYEQGNGVEQDYEKALEYYYLSAEAEDADFKGMRYAGLMYMDGTGVSQDYSEAASCFEIAANAGDVSAAYYLGQLYQEGLGVEQSDTQAKYWYEVAVSTLDEFLSGSNNGPDELKLALCKLAEIALEDGDIETAVQYYQYAVDLGWSDAEEKLAELQADGQ